MNPELQDPANLRSYLDKVQSIFGTDKELEQAITQNGNKIGALTSKFFHATTGSSHSLSFDGQYNPQGYLGQAELVQNNIRKIQAKKTLELASGKGLNSIYLAQHNPDVAFIGLDLEPEHVRISQERAKGLPNLSFRTGNFQELPFEEASFDLVFEIESICHSTDMEKALKEVMRVLRPGGCFVAIEGFRNSCWETASADLKRAAQITDVVLGIGNPWKIDEWQQLCEKIGFNVLENENLSSAIMPNLFQQRELAQAFFKFPEVTKLFLKILPYTWLQNAILGSLALFVVSAQVQSYYRVVLIRC